MARYVLGWDVTLELRKQVNIGKIALKKRFLKDVKFLAAVKIGACVPSVEVKKYI